MNEITAVDIIKWQNALLNQDYKPTYREVDVLKYIAIKKYDETNAVHRKIAEISKNIHDKVRETSGRASIIQLENALDEEIHKLFS